MDTNTLLFITGPTASGKTSLALREAERRNAVILSCDSLCFYRGMNIGTAKPTPEEQARVPHLGIDICEPDKAYSVSRYVSYRDKCLQELQQAGRAVVVVGGSGFYLKSFFSAVTDDLEISPEVIKTAEAIRRNDGLKGLETALREKNPTDEAFEGLDFQNPRRVEKALIRCLASEKSYSQLLAEFRAIPEPLADWNKEVWQINRSMSDLQERNARRVEAMLRDGLVDEVRGLKEKGFEHNPSACGAIGYREVLDFLDGNLSEEMLPEMIFIHTNQLMRKQRTWFRHQIPVDREVEGGQAD
ncbi:MAG: tRNA (adenosine(37)-N6)-dimethylallyltransferase MiaA [Puniceicoccaceae bacterium]